MSDDLIHSTTLPKKWTIVQRFTIGMVGLASKFWVKILNQTEVHNVNNLLDLIENKPKHKAIITVSNHVSCCDDPMSIGASLPLSSFFFNLHKFRWLLGAKEVCFTEKSHSIFFRMGKVLPVVRGDGVYQRTMNIMAEELKNGSWLHIFPEGKINLEKETLRLRWGVGRLIAELPHTPIVVPFYHYGFDEILPNTEPYVPQINKKSTIVYGNPIYFDELVKEMKANQKSPIEMRKAITDKIQEEFYKLKEEARKYHDAHLLK